MNPTNFTSPNQEKMNNLGINRNNFDICFHSGINNATTAQIWDEISPLVKDLHSIYAKSKKPTNYERNFDLFESQEGKATYRLIAEKVAEFALSRDKSVSGYSVAHEFDYSRQKTWLIISPLQSDNPTSLGYSDDLLIHRGPKKSCVLL